MSRIKAKNTKPELLLRKYLFSQGFRYRIHATLPGKPDLVFSKKKLCVFVNGCFWHMHEGCKNFVKPKTNTAFWIHKIQLNVSRDIRNYSLLEKDRWKVIVVWECSIEKDIVTAAEKILISLFP